MQIQQQFSIALPPDEAYRVLLDLDRVAPCLPGAELGDELEDGSRRLKVKVTLGPMRFVYEGSVRVAEQDETSRRALLVGGARETNGQGTAQARIAMTVGEDTVGSSVSTSADVELTGRAAQMGHGMVEAVSEQLLAEMSANLEASLPSADRAAGDCSSHAAPRATGSQAEDLRVGRLLWAAIRDWFARLFRRGGAGNAR